MRFSIDFIRSSFICMDFGSNSPAMPLLIHSKQSFSISLHTQIKSLASEKIYWVFVLSYRKSLDCILKSITFFFILFNWKHNIFGT